VLPNVSIKELNKIEANLSGILRNKNKSRDKME
jgi:hypothetical protein